MSHWSKPLFSKPHFEVVLNPMKLQSSLLCVVSSSEETAVNISHTQLPVPFLQSQLYSCIVLALLIHKNLLLPLRLQTRLRLNWFWNQNLPICPHFLCLIPLWSQLEDISVTSNERRDSKHGLIWNVSPICLGGKSRGSLRLGDLFSPLKYLDYTF